jgi:hypothetical protein
MAKKKAKRSAKKKAKTTRKKAPKKATNPTPTKGRASWPKWAEGFLRGLETFGDVQKAAGSQGRSRDVAYALRWKDPEFAKMWEVAHRRGRIAKYEKLANNSLERATDGHTEWMRDQSGNLLADASGQPIPASTTFFPALEKFHLQMGLPKLFNLATGDTAGGVGGDTPEQTAEKVRAVLEAMDRSVPK